MKGKKSKILALGLALIAAIALAFGLSAPASAETGGTPEHSKSANANNDGTYTLELSVTGDSETNQKKAAFVNVLIIYDESSSMTSNNVTTGPNRNRADYAEDVMHDFIAGLVQYQNTTDDPSTPRDERENIEVAIVGFGPNATTRQEWTTNLADTGQGANRWFDDGVDGTTTSGHNYGSNNGTNWQAAMSQAQTVLNGADSDPTFVIFVTDGAPTAASGQTTINPNQPANRPWTDFRVYYNAATAGAYAIQSRDNTTMYGIYAYGTEADLLDDLMYYSNTGQHRSIDGYSISNATAAQHNFGATEGTVDNYYNAANTAALNAAIEEIFQNIVQALGVSQAVITDGTTNQVTTSTGEISELLEVDESSYEYYLSVPVQGGQYQRIKTGQGSDAGTTITYNVTDNGNGTCTVTWEDPAGTTNSATVKGSVSGGQFEYQWIANDADCKKLYNYDPPAASLGSDGAVKWDLSSVGTLLNEVKYTVKFKVYPSQETLDAVADIKNDPYVDENNQGAWGELDSEVQKYITQTGDLKTNTDAKLEWVDTREENPQPHEDSFTNPDPVPNAAVESMAVTKDWSNLLESDWDKPENVKLQVTRDTKPCYDVTLDDSNSWSDSVYISVGIMGSDGQPLEGSEGHDFTFTEDASSGYHWEINAPTVHPMLINGERTMLIKVDDDHPLPDGTPESDIYEFNGGKYYVGDENVALTAVNERRSSINLKKVVDGDDAPENAIFPFSLTVTDSLAPETEPENDPNHDSDYWIWISVRDKDGGRINEGVEGATSAGSGWWYAPSGSTVTIPAKAGYSIRINNLPTGSTYEIVEGDTETAGFVYDSTTIELTEGEGEWAYEAAQTSTGSVDTTNALYTITYTNKYGLVDVNVDKIWDDNSDQDGVRPDDLTLTLKANGTAVADAPDPVIEESEDGNTWTYTWSGMDRFDADGNEIEYTVTEESVPQYYTCDETTAEDGGTITNVHTPETKDLTVTKVWEDDDDAGDTRPASIQVQLLADGENSGEPQTLSADDWTYTWEDLPVYADGEEIEYSVDEVEVEGYTTTVGELTETDDGWEITITNSNVTVDTSADFFSKIVTEGKGDSGKAATFNFTLTAEEGTPMPAKTSGKAEYAAGEDGEKDVDFGKVTYSKVGTYTYTITEADPATGWVVDPESQEATVTVTVTKDENGKLTADVDDASITNSYEPEPVEVTLHATKAIEGAEWPAGQKLTLTLAGEGDAPTPEETTAELTEPGTADFGPIEFTGEGTYTYTITEDGFGDGWSGTPENGITATVVITDVDGELTSSVTYDPEDAKITNKYEANGSVVLQATKDLQGRDWMDGETFTFTLFGPDGKKIEDQTVSATATTASFTAINFDQDDAGETYVYTIEETGDLPANVSANPTTITATVEVVDKHDGTLDTNVTYDPDPAKITNTYEPTPVTAQIKVKKTLSGTIDGMPVPDFTFTLTGQNDAPMPEDADGATVTIHGAGEDVFGTIEYTEVGEYTYTIQESEGDAAGWTYDTEEYTVKVNVTDDPENGVLVAKVVYASEDDTSVVIDNSYAETHAKVTLKLKKTVQDQSNSATDATFEFTLTPVGNAPGETQTKTVEYKAGDGTTSFDVMFDEIDFDSSGEFKYTLKETQGGEGDAWTNDTTEYTVTVKIADNFDEAKLELDGDPDYAGNTSLEITNYYKAEETKATLKVNKETENTAGGAAPSTEFTFTLTGVDGAPMPGDAATATASVMGAGVATFDEIVYDKAGTFNYTIQESKGSAAGWSYDTTAYNVQVTVEDVSGKLVATVVYNSEPDTELTVTNTYTPKPAKVTPRVNKVVIVDPEDIDAPDATFTFTLTPTGDAPGTAETKSVDNGGVVTFSELEFDKIGSYEYTIQETQGGSGVYWDNDTSSHTMTVEVTDPGKGQLEATVKYDGKSDLKITNTYAPEPVWSDPPVEKVVKGDPKTDETFTFQMKALDGGPMPEGSDGDTKTMEITGSGSKEFGKMYFYEPGEWTYEITEVAGSAKGYTYDTTAYTLTVTVEQEEDGTLVKTETIEGGDEIVFTNEYKSTPGKKTPKTGDNTPLGLVAVLLGMSGVAFAASGARMRRER